MDNNNDDFMENMVTKLLTSEMARAITEDLEKAIQFAVNAAFGLARAIISAEMAAGLEAANKQARMECVPSIEDMRDRYQSTFDSLVGPIPILFDSILTHHSSLSASVANDLHDNVHVMALGKYMDFANEQLAELDHANRQIMGESWNDGRGIDDA